MNLVAFDKESTNLVQSCLQFCLTLTFVQGRYLWSMAWLTLGLILSIKPINSKQFFVLLVVESDSWTQRSVIYKTTARITDMAGVVGSYLLLVCFVGMYKSLKHLRVFFCNFLESVGIDAKNLKTEINIHCPFMNNKQICWFVTH